MGRFSNIAVGIDKKQVFQGVPGVPMPGNSQKTAVCEAMYTGTPREIEVFQVFQGVPAEKLPTETGTPGTPEHFTNIGLGVPVNTAENSHFLTTGTPGTPGTPHFINVQNEAENALAEAARRGAAAYAAVPHDFEERAALIQFGANVPRHWAEPFARLNVMERPPAYTPERWYRIIDDGGRFLDRWAAIAEELGWTAEEVFGVSSAAPEARPDLKGLVALINGWEVTAIAADKATIRNPKTGNCLSIYRRADAAGRCLLWELKK